MSNGLIANDNNNDKLLLLLHTLQYIISIVLCYSIYNTKSQCKESTRGSRGGIIV